MTQEKRQEAANRSAICRSVVVPASWRVKNRVLQAKIWRIGNTLTIKPLQTQGKHGRK